MVIFDTLLFNLFLLFFDTVNFLNAPFIYLFIYFLFFYFFKFLKNKK